MRVWLYYRLSRDEDEELESLTNQKSIIEEYAKSKQYKIVGESFDDNMSGMNFNREGIYKLNEQVENKKIDAVIVKDLSRLGRHRSMTDMYIEYLLQNGVRVISVTENIDTSNESDSLIIGVKGIFNDMYARDISRKVRAGMYQKQKDRGLVTIPPLGYFKDKNTNKVVIVEEHAAIVKRIFEMYLSGYGFNAIAKKLNDEEIKSPAYYQKILLNKELGYNKPSIGFRYLWDGTGVKRILQNDFYIGTLTCHKTYNSKITHVRRYIPEEEQIKHENFAPPIISKEIFNLVQRMMESKKRGNVRASSNKPCHRYSGLLKCGDCGSTFVCKAREWKDKPTRIEYACNGYHRYGKENCTPHRINESDIDRIVYGEIMHIREQAETSYNRIESDVRKWIKNKGTVQVKLDELEQNLKQEKSDQKDILLARIKDEAHSEVYDEMLEKCESNIKRITDDINKINNYNETIKKRKADLKHAVEIIDEVVKEGAISDANLRMLIERIVIYEVKEGLHLEIELNANFKNHRNYYDENGVIILDSNSENRPTICNNYKLRKQGRKTAVVSRP
ncbi:MAG: recombinase family protein [Ruminococcus sp.]|nr:recombinase family protein [Ruminococcus sp.]